MLFEVPDLGKTPLFNLGTTPLIGEATAGAMKINEALRAGLAGLSSIGTEITLIEIFAPGQDLFENPTKYGVFNSVFPCVSDTLDPVGAVCNDDQAATLVYYDPVHPNTQIHSEIALRVAAQVPSVPLPASPFLLIGALGGMVLSARKKLA